MTRIELQGSLDGDTWVTLRDDVTDVSPLFSMAGYGYVPYLRRVTYRDGDVWAIDDLHGDNRILVEDGAKELLHEELQILTTVAKSNYEHNRKERGDVWLLDEPRRHFYKGIDELCSAEHLSHTGGNIAEIRKHSGDGLNHVLMALAILSRGAKNE